MKPPLLQCIKPGIVHPMAFPACMKGEGPILESIQTILIDPFFEVIEIAWIKDPSVRVDVRRLIEGRIDARYGAHPRLLTQNLDLNHLEEVQRQRAVREMKAGIDEAAELGIRDVILLSGRDVAHTKRCLAIERLERSLVELCSYAAKRSQNVVLEVFDQTVDKKCLIGPADLAQEIATRVKRTHPNFGLLVDLSHIVLIPETPSQALLPVKDHLVHVHIGNAYIGANRTDPAWGDNHPRFGYPGGENDVREIAEFLRVLLEIGYLRLDGSRRGAISFEIKPQAHEEATDVIAEAKQKLHEAWSLVT